MKKCIVCGNDLSAEPLLICPNMPKSAQIFLQKDDLSECGETLNLHQCMGCGLIQFYTTPVSYYRDVIRAGGYSTTMRDLRYSQYQHFIDLCNLKGKKIIEIGCGGGEFLQTLTEFPVQAFGIEHKQDLVDCAKSIGLNVRCAFTDAEDTILADGPFDAFLSFNFLEHQPQPNVMLRCIYNNLTDEGCGLITVPSFEYIIEHHSYYELLRDHIANYTQETLKFLCNRNGFDVIESNFVNTNKDTIAVIVKKKKKADVSKLIDFYANIKEQIQTYAKKCGEPFAVWGASHQGLTILSTTEIGKNVSFIIDSAPFKQGKYAPASHVPVVSPDYFLSHPVKNILILAPGYIEEIKSIIRTKFGKKVQIAAFDGDKLKYIDHENEDRH